MFDNSNCAIKEKQTREDGKLNFQVGNSEFDVFYDFILSGFLFPNI